MDSLSHCDRKRRASCSISSLSSAAAGGVGAVFCTADSSAGEQPSSDLSLLADKIKLIIHVFVHVSPQAYHQSLKNHPSDTSISGLSHIRLFLTSFSQVLSSFFYHCRTPAPDKNRVKMLHKMSPTEQKHFMIQSQRTH